MRLYCEGAERRIDEFSPAEHGLEDEEVRFRIEFLDAFGESTCIGEEILSICSKDCASAADSTGFTLPIAEVIIYSNLLTFIAWSTII